MPIGNSGSCDREEVNRHDASGIGTIVNIIAMQSWLRLYVAATLSRHGVENAGRNIRRKKV